ncbi:hypothetical protein [Rosistilla oblonga]|uniref:hypothetical protein n=1 Tax=Rosistilla oblonga TaxID=2527990 RepID=UPI003A96CED7
MQAKPDWHVESRDTGTSPLEGGRRRGDGSVDVRVTALLMPASDPLGLPKCCGTERFRLAIRTSPTPAQKLK